jgi:pyrimidine operon attenuation protein / uracil phosphoribosyltransferase
MTAPAPDAEELLAILAERLRPALKPDTGLVGIHTGGVWVAQRLHALLGFAVPLGTIDVSFYRDDYAHRGLSANVRPSDIPFDVAGRDIVLVDDVLYTGRTIRAAMNEIFDYGRPGNVMLAALVDRGGRQLPIAPHFLGGELSVADGERIVLHRAADGALRLAVEPAASGENAA